MDESIRSALAAVGLASNGVHGLGPTSKQWNKHRPAGTPMAKTLACRYSGVHESGFDFEAWNDLLQLAGLRYPPDLLATARAKANSSNPNYTGADVEFVYGRAQDSVLHTRDWAECTIWHPGMRQAVTVEIAMVVSGERLRPVGV